VRQVYPATSTMTVTLAAWLKWTIPLWKERS